VTGASIGQGVELRGETLYARVYRLHGELATASLPLHARAAVGDEACLRADAGIGIDPFPTRLAFLSVVAELGLYPALPFIGAYYPYNGVQIVPSMAVEYHAELPFALRATLAHGSMTFISPSNIAAVDFSAGASFDTRGFELGLGVGVMSVNEDPWLGGLPYPLTSATAAFTVDPLLRIGAIDGLDVVVTMQVPHVKSFEFGGMFGTIQIPAGRRAWLLLRGGASRDGFFTAGFAERWLFRGNGGRGSIFFLVSQGVAASYFEPTNQFSWGPGLSFGVELRP